MFLDKASKNLKVGSFLSIEWEFGDKGAPNKKLFTNAQTMTDGRSHGSTIRRGEPGAKHIITSGSLKRGNA